MDDTRQAIRQGRVLADEGLYTHAHDAWKAALSGAYAIQDYAGMFVLSGNVGEACVRLAAQEKNELRARKLLSEATEHLDYSLQVVEQCSLRGVMGGYRALYRSVRRVEGLRRKVEEQLQQLVEKEGKCTTCGGTGEMVLDENDGCNYCSKCYEEFYAVDIEEAAVEEVAEKLEVGGEDKKEEELVAVESDPTDVELVGAEAKDAVDERNEKVVQDGGKVVRTDRVRYERVELGSLADFLAGKLPVDGSDEKCDVLSSDASKDELLPVDAALADVSLEEESGEDPDAAVIDRQDSDVNRATLDGVAAAECAEEGPTLNEEECTANAASGKRQYSVAQLLVLRQHSPVECPTDILTSPVRDDGSAPSPARNKAGSNGRKKANSSKKTSR
jgi:hypothetical protein